MFVKSPPSLAVKRKQIILFYNYCIGQQTKTCLHYSLCFIKSLYDKRFNKQFPLVWLSSSRSQETCNFHKWSKSNNGLTFRCSVTRDKEDRSFWTTIGCSWQLFRFRCLDNAFPYTKPLNFKLQQTFQILTATSF